MQRWMLLAVISALLAPLSAIAQTDTDDPDYYLGRVDAWLTSQILGGDVLRVSMGDPNFANSEWYMNQISAVGLIVSTDMEIQAMETPSFSLLDIHSRVQDASTTQARSAESCGAALVSKDNDDTSRCQREMEFSTAAVRLIRNAIEVWQGGDLDTSSDQTESSATVVPSREPTQIPDNTLEPTAAEEVTSRTLTGRLIASPRSQLTLIRRSDEPGTPCAPPTESGIDRYIDIVVRDADGTIIGTGGVENGRINDDAACSFEFEPIELPESDIYVVEIGDVATLTLRVDELDDLDWDVEQVERIE